MTEAKERRKKTSSGDQTQRAQQMSVGETLRRARLEKGLGLEQVSSSINIRVAQLRALEEGNIEGLPGMTYALGFVRSYANYLRLNSGEIVHKFKAEHGGPQSPKQEYHLPEPIEESGMPSPQMLIAAGGFVVVLLILWAVFSGGEDAGTELIVQVPPPPVVQPLSEMASAPLFATETTALAETAGIEPVVENEPSVDTEAEASQQVATMAPEAVVAAAEVKQAIPATPEVIVVAPPQEKVRIEAAPPVTKPVSDTVINVSRGKSRIVLEALQPSWIQVSDAKEQVLLKKVLRPGEKYFVPDEKGITLITSNAGGLTVSVDGAVVQSLGKSGEILRGVAMNPEELKRKKIRTRN